MPITLKNILRNRRRSLLTAFSIAASFCMLGVLMAMYSMFFLQEATPEQALRLIVRNRISFTNPVPLSYESRIAAVPGVKEVMKYQFFGGVYKDTREMKNQFARFAVDAKKLFRVYPEYVISEADRAAFFRERNACILGRPLAQRLGLKAGDHITLIGDIFPMTLDFVVRGFYDSPRENEHMYFHFEYLNESSRRRQLDWISMFAVLADSPESVPAVARSIDTLFRNAPEQTKTESEKALQLSFLAYIGNVKLFLIALCASLSIAILFVTANTMAMSVRERVSEVGVLKTLGFTREYILGIFVGESVGIALAGGLVGLTAAVGLIALLRTLPSAYVDIKPLALSPPLAAFAMIVAAGVGVASSAVPAWTASRMSIVDSLKFTD